MALLEESSEIKLDFGKLKSASTTGDLIPAVIQDVDSSAVLLVAYVNQVALDKTIETGRVTLWSTSRNELWVKGDTSGNWLELVEARVNCEQNSLLFLVRLHGQGACHTKSNDAYRKSCYYRKIENGKLVHLTEKSK